jgi:hypothetical protein
MTGKQSALSAPEIWPAGTRTPTEALNTRANADPRGKSFSLPGANYRARKSALALSSATCEDVRAAAG